MATVRWGIIGCGDVCEVKSGPALYRARDSALSAVMRRDTAKAADFARRHRVARWYGDADALIADPEVDAVYIATPPNSHADYTRRAAAAGKHVLVEKPMAMSVAECTDMIAACETAGVNLYVAYYRRALPRFEQLRELAQDGTLGPIRVVSVNHFWSPSDQPGSTWRLDPAVNGGGIFVDTQCHTLDWLGYVFGQPLTAAGVGLRQAGAYPAEDAVGATLSYSGGVLAGFTCSYVADRFEESVTLIGDRGRAEMSFFSHSPISLEIGGSQRTIDVPDPQHVHQPLVQQIVDHLNGGPRPAGQPEAGLQANRVLAQILADG